MAAHATDPLIDPDPVTAKLHVAACPSQIVVVPLNTAVGLGFTVTTALPLKSPGCAAHPPSLRPATDSSELLFDITVTFLVLLDQTNTKPPREMGPTTVHVHLTAQLNLNA